MPVTRKVWQPIARLNDDAGSTAADHAPHIHTRHGAVREFLRLTGYRPEERPLAIPCGIVCCPTRKSCDQHGEITRRHYLRAFVVAERQQPALVACDQIIGLARFGQAQKKIVRGIGRALHARQRIDVLGEFFDLVDQAVGLVRFDEFGHTWLLQRCPQLVDMRRADQERKFSVQPGVDDSGGLAGRGDQGGMLVSRTTRIRFC